MDYKPEHYRHDELVINSLPKSQEHQNFLCELIGGKDDLDSINSYMNSLGFEPSFTNLSNDSHNPWFVYRFTYKAVLANGNKIVAYSTDNRLGIAANLAAREAFDIVLAESNRRNN